MRRRLAAIAFAVVMALCACMPALAFADDAAVSLSSDNQAATLEDCAFALDSFERAQVGSNRPIEDVYRGYAYYAGDEAGRAALVAAGDVAVVYVPRETASELRIDIEDAVTQEQLKTLFKALDDASAAGGKIVPASATWHFTTDASLRLDGVLFLFDQGIGDGYYECIVGEDGTDVTDTENPNYIKPNHACFAQVVPGDAATIVAAPSQWEQAVTFFTTLNYSPLWVTLKTTLTAIVFIFVLGLAAAYLTLHVSTRARDILDTVFTIPMVLPPTVCGFLLLMLLGKNTFIGRFFIAIGFPLIFSWPATVIAAVVVAFPLMYRNARGAFENLDPNMLDAARTLGWSESRIFFKLMMPLSWSSIAAATVLAFARALGEFGATLFLAGNYLGITRTIPIAIFWSVIILIFSFIVILFINLWSRHTTRYRQNVGEK